MELEEPFCTNSALISMVRCIYSIAMLR